jgi:hypothetical protein
VSVVPHRDSGWKEVGSDILSRAVVPAARPARRLTISRPRIHTKERTTTAMRIVQRRPVSILCKAVVTFVSQGMTSEGTGVRNSLKNVILRLTSPPGERQTGYRLLALSPSIIVTERTCSPRDFHQLPQSAVLLRIQRSRSIRWIQQLFLVTTTNYVYSFR